VAGEMLNKFKNLATKKGDKMGDSKLRDAKNALFIKKNRYINVPVQETFFCFFTKRKRCLLRNSVQ
tara:strand:+ start:10673 stop:10870 length:198 start_codon:yes stop_codon:yes gene_type:complete